MSKVPEESPPTSSLVLVFAGGMGKVSPHPPLRGEGGDYAMSIEPQRVGMTPCLRSTCILRCSIQEYVHRTLESSTMLQVGRVLSRDRDIGRSNKGINEIMLLLQALGLHPPYFDTLYRSYFRSSWTIRREDWRRQHISDDQEQSSARSVE